MRSCALVAVVLSVLIAVPPASAQDHVAGQQVLDAAVQQHVRTVDQDRDTVQQFLQRSDVKAIAGKYGVDIRRAESAVATMNASDLASMGRAARGAHQARAGGAKTVTI
jgi:predicted xylose isomerase-like sugar epimerase